MENNQKNEIVEKLYRRFYEEYPSLERFGENGRIRTKEDIHYHFQYLETAFSLRNKKIFVDYIHWLSEVLETRGVGKKLLLVNMQWLLEEFQTIEKMDEVLFYQELLLEAEAMLKSN